MIYLLGLLATTVVGYYYLTRKARRKIDLLKNVKKICSPEHIKITHGILLDDILTDDSMNSEVNGQVTKVIGVLGTVFDAEGRNGKVYLVVDFRKTNEIYTEKEFGS